MLKPVVSAISGFPLKDLRPVRNEEKFFRTTAKLIRVNIGLDNVDPGAVIHLLI
jgi:hypothetical protein